MPTVSAYTSQELKRKIDRIVREDGRSEAQIGSTALELYAALPSAARRGLLEIGAAGREREGAFDQVVAEMSRALLSAKWELLSVPIAKEIRERGTLPAEAMTEDEIAALAVELTGSAAEAGTRRKRRAAG